MDKESSLYFFVIPKRSLMIWSHRHALCSERKREWVSVRGSLTCSSSHKERECEGTRPQAMGFWINGKCRQGRRTLTAHSSQWCGRKRRSVTCACPSGGTMVRRRKTNFAMHLAGYLFQLALPKMESAYLTASSSSGRCRNCSFLWRGGNLLRKECEGEIHQRLKSRNLLCLKHRPSMLFINA